MILASFAVQIKFSDFDEEMHAQGYLANEKLLPESTINKHKLSREEWEEKVNEKNHIADIYTDIIYKWTM